MFQRFFMKGSLLVVCVALFLMLGSAAARAGEPSQAPATPHQRWTAAVQADLSRYQAPPHLAAGRPTEPASAPQLPALFRLDHRAVYQSYEWHEWNIYFTNFDDAPLLLAHTPSSEIHPRLNRGATQIVFASDRDGDYELFSINTDGSHLQQLTFNSWDDVNPSWSPDGARIVYESYGNGQPDITVMNADGSNQMRLTDDPAFDGWPAWSPDGEHIAFTSYRDGMHQIYRMNADGSGEQRLETAVESLYPAWSPDGQTIAFSADGDGDGWLELWTMGADGQGAQQRLNGVDATDFWVRGWFGNAPEQSVMGTQVTYAFSEGDWFWLEAEPFEWVLDGALSLIGGGSGQTWHADVASTDSIAPVMPSFSAPEFSRQEVSLSWLPALDNGGTGTYGYDSEVREVPGGPWQTLQRQSPDSSLNVALPSGKSYQFRVRALDRVYNYSEWYYPELTTVYTWKLDSQVHDNRGNPLPHVAIETNPLSFVTFERGPLYSNYVGDVGSPYTANWSLPGYGSLPETSFALSDGDATIAVTLPPANDVLVDGDFESGLLDGWQVNNPQWVMPQAAKRHTGAYSVYFTANSSAASTLSQEVTIPAEMTNPTLSLSYLLASEVGVPPLLEVRVTDDTATQTVLMLSEAHATWQHPWADLSAWRGETVTLTFYRPAGLRDAYLDDISLGSTSPNLWLGNSGALAAFPGQTVTRTLQYGNSGGVAAPDTEITLTLPPAMTLASAWPMPAGNNPYSWDLGELAAGEAGQITLALTMGHSAPAGQNVVAEARLATPYEAYLLDNESSLAFLVGWKVHFPLIMGHE